MGVDRSPWCFAAQMRPLTEAPDDVEGHDRVRDPIGAHRVRCHSPGSLLVCVLVKPAEKNGRPIELLQGAIDLFFSHGRMMEQEGPELSNCLPEV